jgi:hypothetical protein
VRILIETIDTVRELNRWEIADVSETIPGWDRLSMTERHDRVAELIGEGVEFCKNLEADTLEREIVAIDTEGAGSTPQAGLQSSA